MKLSIIVPCYNEEQNIPLIFDRFCQIINRDDIEVIFVNNGSTDHSQIVLEKLSANHSFAKVHQVQNNIGYGHGIKSGLQEASGEYLAYTHADMQTDPKDILLALKIIEELKNPTNIFVKGNRKGRPLFDQFFTIGMSLFESCYLQTLLWDINAQPNMFHKSFYQNLNQIPNDFSLDLYLLYKAILSKQRLIRFKVNFPKRIHGTSKWNTSFSAKWRFIKRTIQFSKEMKTKV